MKTWIPGILAGILLGTLTSYGYLSRSYKAELDLSRKQTEELRTSAEKTAKELKESREHLSSVEEVNRQLTAKTPAAETPESSAQENQNQAPTEAPQRDRTAEMRNFTERIAQRTVDRWKDSLNLTPDQIARFNQLYQAQLQNTPGTPWNPTALQSALAQVLTPQQKTEYDHAQARESQARMELRVQTQLTQVQAMFDLTETQKDQIFQKFAQMEQTSSYSGQTGTGNRQSRQVQIQQRTQALQGILTADQLRQYQKSMESNNQGFPGR